MISKLYPYKFHFFLGAQLSILFGVIIFPQELFNTFISPLFHIITLFAGILLLHKKKNMAWFIGVLILLAILANTFYLFYSEHNKITRIILLISYFVFHVVVTKEIILQVWNSKQIGGKTILGLISGYISLGFLGFFICLMAQLYQPGSFSFPENEISTIQNLMYYSFITLLTVGYGEILPQTALAQKIALLIGLTGQMYLVILTGIIVGKYISQKE